MEKKKSIDKFWKLGQLYIDEIVRLHRVPVTTISNRDPRFTSSFWSGLQKESGMELRFNTVFHPQTDGQLRKTIQTLENMLRACVLDLGRN